MRGIFITGTDTNVGKTVVSAALFHRYRNEENLRYWKPVQTGFPADDDTATVRGLGNCSDTEICNAGIRLSAPLSPHLAAIRESARIDADGILAKMAFALPTRAGENACSEDLAARTNGHAWIIEGAGGVLVPINRQMLMIDLMRLLGLPALVVGRARLGTINHTLLTIEALRSRSIPVAGVVLVGEPNQDNSDSVEEYGGVEVLGQLPLLGPLTTDALAAWSKARLDPRGGLIALIRKQEAQ